MRIRRKIVQGFCAVLGVASFLSACVGDSPQHRQVVHKPPPAPPDVPHTHGPATGWVTSPYAPAAGLVDVRPFKAGDEVVCPFTRKIFVIPDSKSGTGIVPP